VDSGSRWQGCRCAGWLINNDSDGDVHGLRLRLGFISEVRRVQGGGGWPGGGWRGGAHGPRPRAASGAEGVVEPWSDTWRLPRRVTCDQSRVRATFKKRMRVINSS
jgi:hypothetical protein